MATTKTTKPTTAKKTETTKKSESTKKTATKGAAAKPDKQETSSATRKPSSTAHKTATVQISHEMIAREAYLLWKSRGGCEMENWLEAERNIRARNGLH